jgi:hypothetical protein
MVHRRDVLRGGLAAGAVALGGSLWRVAASDAVPPPSGLQSTPGAASSTGWLRRGGGGRSGRGYGPLGTPDDVGLRLPEGFTGRVVARTGDEVGRTGCVWHAAPDGGAVFATPAGGWIYVSNSEVPDGGGGAGAIRFAPDGTIESAYRLLDGTTMNCAGGAMPWGTWLSCEEHATGLVWECDPAGSGIPHARPAMGCFAHEAAAPDPARGVVYLTEDQPDGCFYRFRPAVWGDLADGALDVLCDGLDGAPVRWEPVPDPSGSVAATRHQVPGATRFDGGEGVWFDRGTCYFTTKGDDRVWAYDAVRSGLRVLYDAATASDPVLSGVDNLTMAPGNRLFVAEDGGDMQVCTVSLEGEAAPFLQVVGHDGSEMTGVAFDPAGDRLYVSSQRGSDGRGVTFEVAGPF